MPMREPLTSTAGRYRLATTLVGLVAAAMLFADWITGGFHPEAVWIEGPMARDGVWHRLLVTLPICFVFFVLVLRRGGQTSANAGSPPQTIECDSSFNADATPAPIERPAGPPAADACEDTAPEDTAPEDTAPEDTAPIECTLPLDDDEYLEIVLDFIERMDARLLGMLSMIERQAFEDLEGEAHWLKGAGGTVGFPDLTAPSRDLMNAARQRDIPRCQELIEVILRIRRRIVLPEKQLQATARD
jgi:HPt (histidine-containing phosphotransfer) domain-containing protein